MGSLYLFYFGLYHIEELTLFLYNVIQLLIPREIFTRTSEKESEQINTTCKRSRVIKCKIHFTCMAITALYRTKLDGD